MRESKPGCFHIRRQGFRRTHTYSDVSGSQRSLGSTALGHVVRGVLNCFNLKSLSTLQAHQLTDDLTP